MLEAFIDKHHDKFTDIAGIELDTYEGSINVAQDKHGIALLIRPTSLAKK